MKKIIALCLLGWTGLALVAHAEVDPHSFEEHDIYAVKGLMHEMMQNHTGTQAEMLYRTSGAFAQLAECTQQHKRHPELHDVIKKEIYSFSWDRWKDSVPYDEYERNYSVKALYTSDLNTAIKDHNGYAHRMSTDSAGVQTLNLIQETFQKILKKHKRIGLHKVHPCLLLSDKYPEYVAACRTYQNDTYVVVSVDATMQVLRIIKGIQVWTEQEQKETAWHKKLWCKMHAQYLRLMVSHVVNRVEALLFHELSHPLSHAVGSTLRYKGSEKGLALNESFTNTLAVLNSDTPLDTAWYLLHAEVYHAQHLPGLLEALKKEGVTRCPEKRSVLHKTILATYAMKGLWKAKEALEVKGEYNPATGAARFMLAEQAIL